MTTTFRIDQVRIETATGPVTYDFTADLTVLAGDTGVGKTTLLELIKFGLGGDGLVAPVVDTNVSEIHISLRAGQSSLQLSRSIAEESRGTVRVIDLVTADRLPDRSVGGQEQTVSDLLMNALGLPVNMRAAAKNKNSAKKGTRITFNDLFRYMYVPQSAINQDIAGSRDKYYEPKRKAVFEFLFGLTNPDILEMRSRLNDLNGRAAEASRDFATIQQFLADSGTESRLEAEIAQTATIRDGRDAKAALDALQDDLTQVIDRETQVLRELLNNSEIALADARQLVVYLGREAKEYLSERRRVEQDAARLTRMAIAGDRLANIEFAVCPRCTQSLAGRDVPVDTCRVCLQPDILVDLPRGQYETHQLSSQIAEINQQLEVIETQARQAAEAVTNRDDLVASLTTQIDERTANRVTPRLQAYADAVGGAERASAERARLEKVLQQWDRADDLGSAAMGLESERSQLLTQIRSAESDLSQRHTQVLADLTTEFQTTVASFGIPNGQSATISPTTYLPMLDGRPFNKVSSAGGIATATQVAYWITLVTVASRMRDTLYPTFLLMDSPRLALNTAEDIANQMYRRFVTQVSVSPGRLQFIVADNELPAKYGREFAELTFSYDKPTIGTVKHPGRAYVNLLTGATDK